MKVAVKGYTLASLLCARMLLDKGHNVTLFKPCDNTVRSRPLLDSYGYVSRFMQPSLTDTDTKPVHPLHQTSWSPDTLVANNAGSSEWLSDIVTPSLVCYFASSRSLLSRKQVMALRKANDTRVTCNKHWHVQVNDQYHGICRMHVPGLLVNIEAAKRWVLEHLTSAYSETLFKVNDDTIVYGDVTASDVTPVLLQAGKAVYAVDMLIDFTEADRVYSTQHVNPCAVFSWPEASEMSADMVCQVIDTRSARLVFYYDKTSSSIVVYSASENVRGLPLKQYTTRGKHASAANSRLHNYILDIVQRDSKLGKAITSQKAGTIGKVYNDLCVEARCVGKGIVKPLISKHECDTLQELTENVTGLVNNLTTL